MESSSFSGKLIKHIRNVLINDNNLICFMNSISCGDISSSGTYHPTNVIKFSINSDNDKLSREISDCSIRICNFSPRSIKLKTLYDGSSRESNYYNRIFNPSINITNIKKYGINIARTIKIKGYLFNFNDVRSVIIKELNAGTYDSFLDVINEIYYIGENNYLVGFSTINGILYIRMQTIEKILKSNTDAEIGQMFKNLLTTFYLTNKKFCNANIRVFKDEVIELIKDDVINRVADGDILNRRYYREHADLPKNEFLQHVKDCVSKKVDEMFKYSVFGCKDNYSYRNLLNEIITRKNEQQQQIFQDGFSKGMQIGMKLEMLGWASCSPNFADDNSNANIWWEKEVKIIPDTFIWQGDRYSIPEKDRSFKITKLYINQTGMMRCIGNHPNVSGTRVCMGDLKIVFSDPLSNIQDTLRRAEELLDVINYDSAYHPDQREELLKVSSKVETLTVESSSSKKKPICQIREVNFDDNDDIQEDVIETTGEIKSQVIDQGKVIAEIFTTPLPEQELQRSMLDQHGGDNTSTERIRVAQPPTYSVGALNQTLEDIRYIDNNGQRRPFIFYAANGNNTDGQIPPPNSIDSRELSLGDSNLMR